MKRRIIAILLALMMAVTLLPISALAVANIDTVSIRLCGDEVVDENGLLIPGYWMSDIAEGGVYYIESKEWFRNGVSEGSHPGTVAPNSVYTVDVVFEANTVVGRFIPNPKFQIEKCIELLSYEVLDNGARARVKLQLRSQPALESFSFNASKGTVNDDGQLVHGARLPSFGSNLNMGSVKADVWKRDGEFISNNDYVVAGHEYEVVLRLHHGEHTSFDINTKVIPPKGFTEQWREKYESYDLRICYKVSSEPTRIIESQTIGLNRADCTDDNGTIKSGTALLFLSVVSKNSSASGTSCWLKDEEKYIDGEKASNSNVLKEGQEYMTTFRLVPQAGYEFAENFTVECDFARSVETSLNEDGSMNVTIVAKPATATPVAKYLDITSPKLKSGAAAPTCSVSKQFEIKGAEWYCVDDEAAVPEGAALQAGKVYTLRLYVATSGKYVFNNFDNAGTSDDRTAPELCVTFNGEPVDSFYGLKSGEYAGCVCVEHTYPIVALTAPSVKTNPAAVSALQGDDVSFSVVCDGDYLNYQWYSLKDGVSTALEGENSATLTIKNVTVSQHNGMSYYCTVSNGSGSVVSRSASLTVKLTPFADVKDNEYYSSAVAWAYNFKPQPVTTGTDATHFSPNATCTRGQTVTFLWRAMGCPEVEGANNPFVDIKESDYFYKAVLWAVENGITNGVDPTHFGPNKTVTRGQTVTFLWRAAGQETVSGANVFNDVKPSDYYYNAVLWAVKNGITNGMSATTFSPNSGCTRGQIVTFLYRHIEK